MKKFLILFLVAIMILAPLSVNAEVKQYVSDEVYSVPISRVHKDHKKALLLSYLISDSMIVSKYDDVYVYTLLTAAALDPTGSSAIFGVHLSDNKNPNRLRKWQFVEATDAENQNGILAKFLTFSLEAQLTEFNGYLDAYYIGIIDGEATKEQIDLQDVILMLDWDNAKKLPGKSTLNTEIDIKELALYEEFFDALANQKPAEEKPVERDIKIKVNGEFLNPEVKPFIENERTMVPLRFVTEALDIKIDWDREKREVLIGEEDELITLAIDSKEAKKADGTVIEIDTPAIIKSERTFVPLRAIAEIFGAKVDWINESSTVIIEKK
ncbi:MAG: copper amine oxidase N-terminal domain-containing protein [Tissierellia bacterium]|nr:copper amine oxidase N-terminal domain-containing protein [Tissierellia bacterium]